MVPGGCTRGKGGRERGGGGAGLGRQGVDGGEQAGVLGVGLVVLEEKLPCFLVESRLGVGLDQKASHDLMVGGRDGTKEISEINTRESSNDG